MRKEVRWTSLERSEDVTEEILEIVQGVVDGWYAEGKIDWENVWDRVDGSEMEDGSRLDLGTDMSAGPLKYIVKKIHQER